MKRSSLVIGACLALALAAMCFTPSNVPKLRASPSFRPTLKEPRVRAIAEAEAKSRGYDLGQFEAPVASYDDHDQSWFVSYQGKRRRIGNFFFMSIDDRTEKASFFQGL